MEFSLDESQVELQQTIARYCEAQFPFTTVADREGARVDRDSWAGFVDLGVLSLLVPERAGGVGLGVLEAAIVFEQLGGNLVSGPVLWSLLAAEQVPEVADGRQLVAGVDVADIVDDTVIVEHSDDIDAIVVLGRDEVRLHPTADLAPPVRLDGLDPLTPVGRFTGLGEGRRIGDGEAARTMRQRGTVLSAAMLVGISSRALDVALDYALEREQFGVAIGSFQAVKHMIADMYVRSVSVQSLMYAAAAVLDAPGTDDVERMATSAKLLASEAAIENASAAIQVLGGMGFTWDMPPNYLLKRAWVIENGFGAADAHAFGVGATIGGAGS